MFGRFSRFRTDLIDQDYTPNGTIVYEDLNSGIMNSLNVSGDMVYTLNPTTVINIRGNYISMEDDYDGSKQKIDPFQALGVLVPRLVEFLHQPTCTSSSTRRQRRRIYVRQEQLVFPAPRELLPLGEDLETGGPALSSRPVENGAFCGFFRQARATLISVSAGR